MSMTLTPLSAEEIDRYRQRGVLRIPAAFPRESALEVRERLWRDAEARLRVSRQDPDSWHIGYWTGFQAVKPALACIPSPRLDAALDQLLGAGSWSYPKQWGGILVSPPDDPPRPWTLTDRNWHWDGPPLIGCLFFALFADLPPRSGGTLLVEGSGRTLEDWYRSLPDPPLKQRTLRHRFLAAHPFLRQLSGRDPVGRDPDDLLEGGTDADGPRLAVTEVAGEAGDVFVCHSNILHAAAVHTGAEPRFMCIRHLNHGPIGRKSPSLQEASAPSPGTT